MSIVSDSNALDSTVSLPPIDDCCQAPCDVPWIEHRQCLTFQELRSTTLPLGSVTAGRDARGYIVVRLVYTHTLCLIGKQQGGLVYTLTLLPGETATLYHSDRHRRTTSEQLRFSTETTFAQFASALYQNRQTGDTSIFDQIQTSKVNASTSGSADVDIWSLGVDASGSYNSSSTNTLHNVSINSASDQFVSNLHQASQLTSTQRSLTISSYEDSETLDTTKRVLVNTNKCYAVNYFVRKVLDVYELTTTLTEVTIEVIDGQYVSGPLTPDQIGQLPTALRPAVKAVIASLPQVGETIKHPTRISIPTDGVIYQPELAHCCAQDPILEAASLIALEREKAETQKIAMEVQLMTLELQRRQALLAAGTLDPFVPADPTTIVA